MSEERSGLVGQLERGFQIGLSADQKHRIRLYVEMIQRWNRRINLTAMERVEELLRLSFFEAFWAAREFLSGFRTLADVGSGAGFPGLAMQIWNPALVLTLIEPNYKKAVFLKEVTRTLGLSAQIFNGKGEDYEAWGAVEVASFRALRPSSELLTLLKVREVDLLLFEGLDGVSFPGLERRRRELVPGSDRRFVSLAGWA